MGAVLTPEFARSVYYVALGNAYRESLLDWSKSVVQHECEMTAWRAVVETKQTPKVESALKEYQDAKSDLRTNPHEIQRLWEAYTQACHEAMNAT